MHDFLKNKKIKEIFDFAEGYKTFLGKAKIERQAVKEAVKLAEAKGYKNIEEVKEIKKGDKLAVETKNEKVEVVQDDHKLVITERDRHLFERHNDREVIVYIPEDMEFEKVGISGGVGSIYIEKLYAKELEMALGIGETKIIALETEKADISTGIGEVSVGLISRAEDYEIEAEKGLGDITLDGKSVSNYYKEGSGLKQIKIKGGIGSIKITTAQK